MHYTITATMATNIVSTYASAYKYINILVIIVLVCWDLDRELLWIKSTVTMTTES